MSLNSREFLIWEERERGQQAGQQADISKVKLGLGELER
jgi:hypothetical protein